MYAEVVFSIASFRSFTYKIPQNLMSNVGVGMAVNAPFKNKIQIGYIVSQSDFSNYKGKLNEIDSLYEGHPNIPEDLWKTIIWMSKYYIAPLGLCIKSALPSIYYKDYSPQKILYIELTSNIDINILKLSKNQKIVMDFLQTEKKSVLASTIKNIVPNPYYTINALEKKQLIKKIYLEDNVGEIHSQKIKITLSKKQKDIFDTILPSIKKSINKNFLIHGIPGSGKTEIYVKLAQEVIKSGKNVMILIPEIILTAQMQKRFIQYFGNHIAMWHSKMTNKEKQQTIKNILLGENKIIIGARSSIFAPMPNIGLIVIDEEQDHSYKQDSPKPYYNARDIALIRSKYSQCPTILTSATPSIESYYNTLIGKSQYIELKERYYKSKDPVVQVIDMIKNIDNDEHAVISNELEQNIKETLNNEKQIILLNNRRGYASTVFSKELQGPILCESCNVPMSLHKSFQKLLCHYCDYNEDYNKIDKNFNNYVLNGYGTEKIYEITKKKFPNAVIARLDSDTLQKKSNLSSILKDFSSGKINILIGTQMISKGLDFNDVDLVGVVNADYGMFIPDFRSGEKTFQIISQVIGRSGRRNIQGKAIIQTYNPDDANLLNAIKSNYKTFYSSNLAERNELQYPPFFRICRLIFSGEDIVKVNQIADSVTNVFQKNKSFKVLGPSEAPISKIKNQWRINSLIAVKKDDPLHIQNFFERKFGTQLLEKKYKNVNIKMDIDPINML
ncbi:MAG: primosomal protein N' [Candidatus Marinimicrobia bacterium]|nr:primosomal protein N' [Candidatus Neomarinimicrobiota bacterium]